MVNAQELAGQRQRAGFRQSGAARHQDVMITSLRGRSGTVNSLFFSNVDRCFYVTIDGRERIRSDSPDTIAAVYNGLTEQAAPAG